MTLPARHRLPQTLRAARPARWASGLTVMVAICALLPAQAARADAGSVTCTGTSDITYSPGLTLTPQNVTVDENDAVPSCTSTDPTVTGMIIHPFSYPITNASCDDLRLDPIGPTGILHWDNGQDSTLSSVVSELTVTGGILQETVTATVTAGEFSGGAAVITWAYPLIDPLQCLAPGGLTTQDGTILVQITSP